MAAAFLPTTHIPAQGWRDRPAHDLWGSGKSKDFQAKLVGPESQKGDLGRTPPLSELFPPHGVVRRTRWAPRGFRGPEKSSF